MSVVRRAVKGKEYVFHLAANASVPNSIKNLDYDFETNVTGTYNILKSVHLFGNNTKVIYASSAAVYGEPQYTPIDESHPLIEFTGFFWKGDVKTFQADITLAKKILGFNPTISFTDGLKLEIEWFRKMYQLAD